jgi:hypothetical protein
MDAEPAAPVPVNEANMVADLETILQERDACGVSLNFASLAFEAAIRIGVGG